MSKIDWHLNAQVFGLSLLTITPGFSSDDASSIASNEAKFRALAETVIFSAAAVSITKSWWPAAIPAMYLAFDWAWLQTHPVKVDSIVPDFGGE